jgi:hypothetical protein
LPPGCNGKSWDGDPKTVIKNRADLWRGNLFFPRGKKEKMAEPLLPQALKI